MLIVQITTNLIFRLYHRIRIGLILSVIPLLILSGTASASQALSLDELAERIQTVYDNTADFKAHFIQEATIKSVERTTKEEGTVYLKKPERMLWDYTRPSMKKLIINPNKAWLYMPDDKMVYVQDAKKILSSKMTIRFLTGIGKLKDDFAIALPDSGPTDATGNHVISLTPHGYEAGIKTLLITVDKDTFHIVECVFTDMYDNTTRLIFSDISFNNNPPDDLFDFTPPQGVEVYTVDGQ